MNKAMAMVKVNGICALAGVSLGEILERKYGNIGKRKSEQSSEVQTEKIRKAEEKRLRKCRRIFNSQRLGI